MINRQFKDIGFKPLLAYIVLTLGFIGLSVYLFYKNEFAEYIYTLCAFTLTSKLSEIRRNEFLELCFGKRKAKKIRIIENVLVIFPFLVFMIYEQRFLTAIVLVILAIILALASIRNNLSFTIWTPFSKRPYEFIAGFRNTYYLIIVIYGLASIAVSVHNFNLGIFAMLLLFATSLGYYVKPEIDFYVWIFSLNSEQFLFNKIKTAILCSSFITFPITVTICIFFQQYIYLIALFLMLGWLFLIFMILCKYAAYPDEMNLIQNILFALCLWFPPMLIILIPYQFQKSKKRLSSLLK